MDVHVTSEVFAKLYDTLINTSEDGKDKEITVINTRGAEALSGV